MNRAYLFSRASQAVKVVTLSSFPSNLIEVTEDLILLVRDSSEMQDSQELSLLQSSSEGYDWIVSEDGQGFPCAAEVTQPAE